MEDILNRKEYKLPDCITGDQHIVITGGWGSIGSSLKQSLCIGYVNRTDIIGVGVDFLDITDEYAVRQYMGMYKPEIIINLAGAKHAPEGEHTTWETLQINTIGVQNLIKHKPKGCRIIQASTCKACNPETAYGASKLLAERMVLNDGGTVVRYYNVIETWGNVFEIWKEQVKTGTIRVVDKCQRYFITLQEAAGLTIAAINLEPGRYGINVKEPVNMMTVAKALYPDVQKTIIEPRRGDRVIEKLHGTSEAFSKTFYDGAIVKIENYHDRH